MAAGLEIVERHRSALDQEKHDQFGSASDEMTKVYSSESSAEL